MPAALGLLALLLAGAPELEEPQNPWEVQGSWSSVDCYRLGVEARVAYRESSQRAQPGLPEAHPWALRADACPNEPGVALMAASVELLRVFPEVSSGAGADAWAEAEAEFVASRQRALGWLMAAQREFEKRDEPVPRETVYYEARIRLGLGDTVGARKALENAKDTGDTEAWRVDRLRALCDLLDGDLDAALASIHRAVITVETTGAAPFTDFIYAMVLDRSGDPVGSRARMKRAMGRTDAEQQFMLLTLVLPPHERVYARALRAGSVDSTRSTALRLWDAYLEREEPEAPERALAEQHKARLAPLPGRIRDDPSSDGGGGG